MNQPVKKISKFLAAIAGFSIIAFAGVAFAQTDNPVNINEFTQGTAQQGGFTTQGVDQYSLSRSIGQIIKIVLSLVGVVFLCLTVYAGFLWMTAGGDTEPIEKAQNIVKAATMGLVVVIGCYGIVVFILAAIGTANNTTTTNVGGVGPGSNSFWGSFGKNFKNNWWRYMF